jgi:hypothetical protein
MIKHPRILYLSLVFIAMSVLLSACALRSLFGNVIITEDLSQEINEIIDTVFSDSTAAVCAETDYGFYDCTYIIDGEIITSTVYLLSEFGIAGVLIDPLIVQIPAATAEITATYDLGSGPQPLVVQTTPRFFVTPNISVTAETGKQFVILELPPSIEAMLPSGDPNNGLEVSYALQYARTQPIQDPIEPELVKIMLAGKAVINEHAYYVPLVPCVTDFSVIPALEIPVSDAPVNLQASVGDLLRQGGSNVVCDHQGYYYNNVPPPPLKVYLPVVRR